MSDLSGQILVLTGPPGAGKTTVARSLVESCGQPAVHLHADDFWHFIRNGGIAPYLPEADKQNGVVMGVLCAAAEGYAAGGYFVVIDGIIGPWFLAAFRAVRHPLHYIVLRPDLDEAIKRCQLRGGDTLTDPVPIGALHDQFSQLDRLDRHRIETAGLSRQEMLETVRRALAGGGFRLGLRHGSGVAARKKGS
ncbi:AAA family ATPase [Mesorhizobium sp. SP-1A]|uniref:AAA family ATPase n=1 Tax=Mesorhizobium sp. SP-1A TaxID=3077840 RepID=UPI0028F735D5|nr:AAA family ATPase [Mesorhizobium sp. SP-1A]